MKIAGLQKLTLIDYPDKPAATVFLAGCNFRCPWCHSRQLVLPEEIKKQKKIPQKDFFDFLIKRKGLIDAVVICGGEPTINQDIYYFTKKIKELGYLVKLDTNGSNPKIIEKLVDDNLLDYIAMDIKAPLNDYKKAIAVDIPKENLLESIAIIKDFKDYEFRTTVIPTIHKKEDIIAIANQIKKAKKYYLQRFQPENTIKERFKLMKDDNLIDEVYQEIFHLFEICKIR